MAEDQLDTVPEFVPPDPSVSEALTDLAGNLAERTFTARSRDGAVQATVDGRTLLLGIDIDDAALLRGHPEAVGRSIVEAVSIARSNAARLGEAYLEQTLDPALPNPDLTLPGQPVAPQGFAPQRPPDEFSGVSFTTAVTDQPPAPPQARPTRRRPVVDDDDEGYDPFGGQRDDREVLVSFYDRMYALVSEIEAGVHAMDAANEQALAQPLTHEIEGGYGTVTVTGGGKLLAVNLDPRGVAGARGAPIGAAVVRAVRAAEAVAVARYQEQMNAAQHDVRA